MAFRNSRRASAYWRNKVVSLSCSDMAITENAKQSVSSTDVSPFSFRDSETLIRF
jgi:hypothetical protein